MGANSPYNSPPASGDGSKIFELGFGIWNLGIAIENSTTFEELPFRGWGQTAPITPRQPAGMGAR